MLRLRWTILLIFMSVYFTIFLFSFSCLPQDYLDMKNSVSFNEYYFFSVSFHIAFSVVSVGINISWFTGDTVISPVPMKCRKPTSLHILFAIFHCHSNWMSAIDKGLVFLWLLSRSFLVFSFQKFMMCLGMSLFGLIILWGLLSPLNL